MGNGYEHLIFTSIGEIGKAQILITVLTKLCVGVMGFAMVMMSFVGSTPGWWKETMVYNGTSNTSYIMKLPQGCPILDNETVVFDSTRKTIVSEWELVCSRQWIPSVITTTQMVGVMVGVLINGQLGDWVGRRKTLLFNLLSLVFFMFLFGCSVNWQMAAACMFFVGSSCGAFLAVVGVYAIEFLGTSWRTSVSCIPAWPLGILLLGGSIKVFANWSHVSFTGAVAGIIVLVLLWFCPESIRWLFVHGQMDQGKNVIKKIAKFNGRSEPDLSSVDDIVKEYVTSEFRQIKAYNYITVVRNKFARWRVLLFGITWFSMSVSYYTIMFGVGSLHGDVSVNMILSGLVQCFGVIAVWILSKCFRRKYTSFVVLLLSGLSCLGITIAYFASDQGTFRRVQQGLAITSAFFLASCWRSVILHTLEIFPTVLRSIAYACVSMFARVGGMVAPQTEHLRQVSTHLPFTVVGTILIGSACCTLLLEDTYDSSLDDYLRTEPGLIEQIDGEEKDEKV